MSIRTDFIVGLMLLLEFSAMGQAAPDHVNFCDIVKSPAVYNDKVLITTATLFPGYHSLLLHSKECESMKDHDVRTEAVLPLRLESLSNGRKLKSILNHGRSARVEAVGVFESNAGPYGPDDAPFRFMITSLNSVAATQGK